ncbi:L-rhamnose-binding lectin SML-like [Xyrichtys novacula]|uniref:L-rhamnose-binding lectin SML-like n=1 Tax=Xyrichtys novacula TaxID=13765 RepID=A0AAV1F394_XYRNO|nr:L-rhamnose-binding lectin SML-like [Xyrichtys novacula]
MLHLSSTLLSATACPLVSAANAFPGSPIYTVTTCEGNNIHRLSCDSGVISIQTTLYGRADTVTCSEGKSPQQIANTKCLLSDGRDVLKRRCDGKMVCELSPTDLSEPDSCSGTYKYLKTGYICLPATHLVTCEHSSANMQCGGGQVIFVYGAHYGRVDHSTCSYRRPATQIENVYCSVPATKVSESCNGKNSCVIKASNSEFGDPCVGTHKYLEVAYVCEFLGGPLTASFKTEETQDMQ